MVVGVSVVTNYFSLNAGNVSDGDIDTIAPVISETYAPTEVDGCRPNQITSRPYLVSIPAASIENACVESVGSGQEAAGQLDDPEDLWHFGWFKASPAPSTDGQGVYTCHSGYGGVPALCDGLTNLSIGAEIIVENSAGKKFHYEVVETKIIAREAVDMAEFQSVPEDSAQGFSLMTCVGAWDSQNNTMRERLIVRAVLQ